MDRDDDGLAEELETHLSSLRGDSEYKASQLAMAAFEQEDPDEAAAMARKALKISEDCADALLVLGELEAEPEARLKRYKQALAAGREAIEDEYGEDAFEEYEGSFWSLLETRPYMRARTSIAETLCELGRKQEAIEHYEAMLELNPHDNQGIRDLLASLYLEEGELEKAEQLLDRFAQDPMAAMAFSRALLAFLREGPTAGEEALGQALDVNEHVPAFLVGEETLPEEGPPRYSPGSREEAVIYAAHAKDAWQAHPEALAWLEETRPG